MAVRHDTDRAALRLEGELRSEAQEAEHVGDGLAWEPRPQRLEVPAHAGLGQRPRAEQPEELLVGVEAGPQPRSRGLLAAVEGQGDQGGEGHQEDGGRGEGDRTASGAALIALAGLCAAGYRNSS